MVVRGREGRLCQDIWSHIMSLGLSILVGQERNYGKYGHVIWDQVHQEKLVGAIRL